MALTVYQVGYWAHMIGSTVRSILPFVSCYKPRICKLYLYLELILDITDQMMVAQNSMTFDSNICINLKTTILFYNLYYEFWPSLFGVTLK